MRRLVTFSKLDLASHCKAWTEQEYEDTPGPAAVEGTRKHAIIQAHIERGETVDEPWFKAFANHWKRNAPKEHIYTEVPLAIDFSTGTARVLPSSGQRDYSACNPTEICGTLDLLAISDTENTVWDWKTGQTLPGKAEDSLQLKAGALAANLFEPDYPMSPVNIAYKHVGHSRVTQSAHRLEIADMPRIFEQLRRIHYDTTEPRPGPHCYELWCPARFVCPAFKAVAGSKLKTQSQPKQQETTHMAMTLDAIKKGRIDEPHRVLLYGVEGVGKSTFGAHAPSPIFLASERGTAELDVARFPEPKAWDDVFDALQALHGVHSYRTLVVDTVDWLEPTVFAHCCEANGWASIDKPAWGAGYTAAVEEWRKFLAGLNRLQDVKRMHIVLLGHSTTRGHRHPDLDDFDRFELSINKKAAALLKEWARTVLFCDYETCTYEEGRRTRAVTSGARWIHTTWRPAWDAKNRLGLPDKIPLSWADFEEACNSATQADSGKAAAVLELAASFGDADLLTKVKALLADIGNDSAKLDALTNRLNAKKQQAA